VAGRGERVVPCHDLGSDHQVELVDEAVRQQIGPQRAAAEDQRVTILLA
jgi:hypothetical protein